MSFQEEVTILCSCPEEPGDIFQDEKPQRLSVMATKSQILTFRHNLNASSGPTDEYAYRIPNPVPNLSTPR